MAKGLVLVQKEYLMDGKDIILSFLKGERAKDISKKSYKDITKTAAHL